MKSINIWKIVQLTIFQMVNVWCYKIMHALKIPSKCKTRPIDFNITDYQEFTDTVSDATLQLTFK